MLATTWDKIRDEKSRVYGPHSYVYRSTDGGRTWTNVHNAPLPQSETDPALQTPDNLVGRMGVDFSDSDPTRAYLISSTARGELQRLLHEQRCGRDLDSQSGSRRAARCRHISGGFAWWFGRVYVDPVNSQHVFVDGVNLAESLNGGLTWTTLQTRRTPTSTGSSGTRLTAEAGSTSATTAASTSRRERRGRGTWTKTARLPVTQFYAMDVSVQDGSRVNAGSQDNDSLKSWSNATTVTGDWITYVGGDGMMNRIDPTNDRKFYGCSQNGGCRRFFPGGTNNGVSMTIPGARKNWVAPLEFAADPRFMFGASENVYRIDTEPASDGPHLWPQISPDLTDGTELPRAPGFGTITALGTTAADPNLLYAGTDSGRMWVSRNAMAAIRPR